MRQRLTTWSTQWGPAILAWLVFYLTIHFNVNDERYSFWLPMKFIVAVPQVVCSMVVVYGFGRLMGRPLEVPVGWLLFYLLIGFVLLHLVYYYALAAAQPFAPAQSVNHRRWTGFMAGQGPFYFVRNPHYLRTVSPYLFFAQLCVPLGVKLLADAWREQQQLIAARRRQLQWELAAVRGRLNPVFLQQTLTHLQHLLSARQPATAAEVTLKLAQVLRYTLYETSNALVPLQHELDHYLDYVQLHELRWPEPGELTCRLTVEPGGPRLILPGVLLPFTAQWLALAPTSLDLELRVHGAQLTLALRAEGGRAPAAAALAPLVAHLTQAAPGTHQLAYDLCPGQATLRLHLALPKAK
ncbi:MAG: histidine kinase [Hymenobacter sp.]|nr:histidine kinase [Hymenobacter sp.]